MKKFIDHAESAHNMPVLTADVIFKVKKAIKKVTIQSSPGTTNRIHYKASLQSKPGFFLERHANRQIKILRERL